MNPLLCPHPAPEQLSAFRVGKVSPDELTEIERHLADCPHCCASLKGLPDDSLVGLLRASVATPEPDVTCADVRPSELTGDLATPRPPSPLPPELRGHPKYHVLELLGTGGMGSVYRAEHRVMERHVALKIINRELMDRPAVVERFHREVKAAA